MFDLKATWLSTAVIFLSSLIYSTLAGRLTPSGTFPINPTVTNKGKYGDYTFTFTPDTQIPIGSVLKVVFPSQYLSGLGIPLTPSCSISCTLNGYVVTFTFSSVVTAGTQSQVLIRNILNPTTKGGTGSFQLTTYNGQNLLDQNLAFGVIGISDDPQSLTTTIAFFPSGASNTAGDASVISFQFKTIIEVPAGSYFRFLIPDTDIKISATPNCSAFMINGRIIQGNLKCVYSNNIVTLTGLSATVSARTEIGINLPVTNPTFSQTTEDFSILILNQGTNLIAQEGLNIPGLTIQPGKIRNIVFGPVLNHIQARNKILDYRISFRLTNPLSLGNVITLRFPESMTLGSPNYNFIMTGLEDVVDTSPVGLVLDSNNVITITNFRGFTTIPNIIIQLRITNPDTAGTTAPIEITTYLDSTLVTKIDSDTTRATTGIANLPSGSSHFISPGNFIADTLIDPLEFNIIPSIPLPAGSTIVFSFPVNLTMSAMTTTNCLVQPYGGTYAAPTSCTMLSNIITIELADAFVITGVNNVKFIAATRPQITNGTFLIDVTTYIGGIIQESWTDTLTTTAKPFTSATESSLTITQGAQNLLKFSFLTNVIIPQSSPQAAASVRKGNIEFEFLNALSNLGYVGAAAGKVIACKITAGLVSASSKPVYCSLYPGAPTAVIKVEGFQDVPAGTTISIEIPGLTNPSTNYQVKIKSIALQNRIKTELNYWTFVFSTGTPLTYYEATTANAASLYTITPALAVTQTSSFQFRPGNGVPLNGPGTLVLQFPNYDTGWVNAPLTSCTVNGFIMACDYYPQSDWITITIPSGWLIAVGNLIRVAPIVTPRYAIRNLIPIARYVRTFSRHELWYKPQQPLPTPIVPRFSFSSVNCFDTDAGAVNVQYDFTLKNFYELPAGSVIRITFPSGYNLLASDPAPVVSTSIQMADISPAKKISYILSVSSFDVYNFANLASNIQYTITIKGVKNPDFLTNAFGFVAEAYFNNYAQVFHFNIGNFAFTSTPGSNAVVFNSITAFPLNAHMYAKYTFTFRLISFLPKGAYLYLTFPSTNYIVLPNPPTCIITGAISSFSTCTLTGSTYAIRLISAFSPGTIYLTIKDILNPGPGRTDGFIVTTRFDGLVRDYTDMSTLVGRTITISSAPGAITMNSLEFDPQNEGEPGTYTFSFFVQNSLSPNMGIMITFPPVFDDNLGIVITCDKLSGIVGDITCTVSQRAVTISGFNSYIPDPSNPITVQVYGVTNPNYILGKDTGQFSIATLVMGSSTLIDNTNLAGTLQTVSAPGWAPVSVIEPGSLFCRIPSTYKFGLSNKQGLPSTEDGGKILVLYPTQFDIPEGDLYCDTPITSFASSLTCSVARNTITVTGQKNEFSGTLTFYLRDVTNPIYPGITDEIVVKTYDSYASKVLERSFRNLDTFYFTYTYPGPLIQVNRDNPITCVRGTQTGNIMVNISFPSTMEITIVPTVAGYSIIPQTFSFTLGITNTSFRISVPQNYPVGSSYITWVTQGDTDPPYYTPIKKTQIIVTGQTGIQVQVGTPFGIPYGGNSLANTIRLALGPDLRVGVRLAFAGNYVGLSFDQSVIQFSSGETIGTFTIYSNGNLPNTTKSGTILVSLFGDNAAIYSLSATSIPFQIILQDKIPPFFKSAVLSNITMNSILLNVQTSEIVTIYYMIALERTAMPSYTEIFNKGPAPYLTTESVYGSEVIGATFKTSIPFPNLVAETGYVIFMYLQDRGGNPSEITQINFKTLDRWNAVNFDARFMVATPTDAEIQVAINSFAFVLSLPPSKIQKRIAVTRLLEEEETGPERVEYIECQDCNDSKRMLAVSIVTFQLMVVADSTLYPSPIQMIALLNTKRTELSAMMSYYDPTFNFTASPFVRYYPNFNGYPAFVKGDYKKATFKVSFDSPGYGFVSVVKSNTSGTDNPVPSPYQIWRGYDSLNVEVPHGGVLCRDSYADFQILVEGLDPSTDYIAYFIGGSMHPGYPDLMAAEQVAIVAFKTTAAPITDIIDDSFAGRFVPIATGFLTLLMIVIYL